MLRPLCSWADQPGIAQGLIVTLMQHRKVALVPACVCICVCCCFCLTLSSLFGREVPPSWRIPYGTAESAVGFTHPSKTNPEDPSFGPLSVRVHGKELWVADSVNGRILCFAADGSRQRILALADAPENTLIEDFSVDVANNRIWLADAADGQVVALDFHTGAKLVRCVLPGGRAAQIKQIETGRDGSVLIWDLGKASLLRCAADGSLLNQWPIEPSGFAIDNEMQIHDLLANALHGLLWRVRDLHGKEVRHVHIGLPDYYNPRIWAVTSTGALLLSVIPPGGFKGHLHLMTVLPSGAIARVRRFAPALTMNRFVSLATDGSLWLCRADFTKAPQGFVGVERIGREGGRR